MSGGGEETKAEGGKPWTKDKRKNRAVKLAGSEGTGKKGWQRVWLDSQSAKEVIRDTIQSRSNVSQLCLPAFALNALPASASSASGIREMGWYVKGTC